ERHLNQKGLTQGGLQRILKERPILNPVLAEERNTLEHVRHLLEEAADMARTAQKPGTDFDRAENQTRFGDQMLMVVSAYFSFNVYSELGTALDARRMKMKKTGQQEDGRTRLTVIADHFDELRNRLTLDQIKNEHPLPGSFVEFLNRKQ